MIKQHEEIERLASVGYIKTSDAYEMIRGIPSTSTTSAVEFLKNRGVRCIIVPWNGDRGKSTHLWVKEDVDKIVATAVNKKKPVAGNRNFGSWMAIVADLQKRVTHLESINGSQLTIELPTE